MTELTATQYYILYGAGILTFIVSILDDLRIRRFRWFEWIQYVLFTLIAITAGIFACRALETSFAWMVIVALACGFLGGSVLIKIDLRKNELSDQVVDSLKDKMKSWSSSYITGQINGGHVYPETPLEYDEHIKSHIVIDNSDTIVDPNQSDYNPFDEMCK